MNKLKVNPLSARGARPIRYPREPTGAGKFAHYFQVTQQFINNHKNPINIIANIVGAIVNLFTFLNGNFKFTNISQNRLEGVSSFFAKIGVVARGVTGSVDCYNKNNLLPLLGFLGEIVTPFLLRGSNSLWLARGVSQGIHQSQGVIKRRGITTERDGTEITLDKNDGDDFAKYGIKTGEGFWLVLKDFGKIIKELFTSPFKGEHKFSHSVFVCSLGQIVGPLISLFGLNKIGAGIRDLCGGLVDVGYIMDKKEKGQPSYLPCGSVWICSAIVDFFKRFNFISTLIKNLTQLSLFFDGIAAAYYGWANFGKAKTSN